MNKPLLTNMINLEQQKEVVAKKALHFVGNLLEQKKIKIADSLNLIQFLSTGIEGAATEEDLKKLQADVKMVYSILPEFEPGI